MNNPGLRSPPERIRGARWKPTIIIASSCLLIGLWRTVGSQSFYQLHLADNLVLAGDTKATAAYYHIGMCFVLLGLVPAMIVKWVLRENLSDYGVTAQRLKWGLLLAAVGAPVVVAIGYFTAPNPAFQAEYPLNRHAGASANMFAAHALSLGLFYVGWELHFRGYLQFGLAPSLGTHNAIWLQVLASCLAHLGKPNVELLASIPGGLFWGVQAYRTRSLLAGFLQHWLLGVAVDYFIVASVT